MSARHFVPERFRRAVGLHVYKNHSSLLADDSPLILGISGPPGEGKTFNTEKCLRDFGVRTVLLSGGQLEHSDAGRPAELVRDAYRDAGDAMDKNPDLAGAALVINDVDTGVGDWGELVQYTVNRQTVFGELMHLCDFPAVVDNKQSRRVPIILTGNNFASLYGPLMRPGRMAAFSWEPTVDERMSVLCSILPMFDEIELRSLQEMFSGQPISFFSHVKSILVDEVVWRQVSGNSVRNALLAARSGQMVPPQTDSSVEMFVRLGHDVAREHEFRNYVAGTEERRGTHSDLQQNSIPA